MHAIDAGILIAFIVYSVSSGFRSRKVASQSLEEYFLAGRTLKGWHAGVSMAATQFAADTPLLVTGLVATSGIFALWRLWIYAVAFLMMGFLLAPSWRRARVLTDAELTELRYGSRAAAPLRGIKAVYFGVIFNCAVLAMVLLAATRIAEPFLLWNQWLPSQVFQPLQSLVQAVGVPFTVADRASADLWILSTNNLISIGAIIVVTTFYSTTGGLRSVVATDVVQFGVAMLATLLFTIIVVSRAGGFSGLRAQLASLFASEAGSMSNMSLNELLAFTPSRAKDASLSVLAVLGLQWLVQMNADGTGYLAQRSMACRTDRDAKVAAVVFTIAQVVLRSLLWIPLALGLLVLFPPDPSLAAEGFSARREFTFVRGISELLPMGVKGLMLVGMLAALASTLDTHLNWGASYLSNDIYKRFICEGWLKKQPSKRTLVWVARGSNGLILITALALVPALSSVQTAWQISLLLGAGMGVMLVLRWIWWRINAWGELAAIAGSLILAPVFLFSGVFESEALRLLTLAACSAALGIGTSLLMGPDPHHTLVEFYKRAHPPGFWGPVAKDAGNGMGEKSVLQLRDGIITVVVAAFSVFSVLTGLGSWIAGSPAPTWFPFSSLWIATVLILGFGLVPVWVRMAFAKPESA